jgi:ABC-type uncharacterized transport system substrate-binding protein
VWARRALAGAVAAVMSLLAAAPAPAHPHIWVEHAVTVLVGPRGIEGVRLAYTFDDMFSTLVLQTFDADGDGTFSPQEIRAIEEKHFRNIQEFDYFVVLVADGRKLPVTARDFHAQVPRDQVTYLFTVPIKGLDPVAGTLEIAVDDPTFYTSFQLAERQPVQVKAAKEYRVECAVSRDALSMRADLVRCQYRRVGG